MIFSFIPLSMDHFPLLLKWLRASHIKKWWDPKVDWTMERIQAQYVPYVQGYKVVEAQQKPIHAFVVHDQTQPIGYIQIYNAYDFPRSHALVGLPKPLASIDFYIGEESAAGQGYGASIVDQFIKAHASSYTHIFVDPHINNQKGIRIYKNAGFNVIKIHESTHEVWMIKENKPQ